MELDESTFPPAVGERKISLGVKPTALDKPTTGVIPYFRFVPPAPPIVINKSRAPTASPLEFSRRSKVNELVPKAMLEDEVDVVPVKTKLKVGAAKAILTDASKLKSIIGNFIINIFVTTNQAMI